MSRHHDDTSDPSAPQDVSSSQPAPDSSPSAHASRGFSVHDRRGQAATTDGDKDAAEAAAPQANTAASPHQAELPAVDFSTFLLSLSTSAMVHLGEV